MCSKNAANFVYAVILMRLKNIFFIDLKSFPSASLVTNIEDSVDGGKEVVYFIIVTSFVFGV